MEKLIRCWWRRTKRRRKYLEEGEVESKEEKEEDEDEEFEEEREGKEVKQN